jgi:hypothetical protein
MRVVLTWPEGVAEAVGLSVAQLKVMRSHGDAPALYAASERRLVTFDSDVEQWIRAKQVPTNYKCRAPTSGSAAA